MKKSPFKYLLVALFVCISFLAKATHNRAGEITYKEIGDLTIEVTVTTYTKANGTMVDRDSILIDWGDLETEFLQRSNGGGQIISNNVRKNIYKGIHVYPGRNTYKISMTDPNRVGEIQNLNFPNSENIRFHLFAIFTFTNQTFDGQNSSVILQQEPIDFACIGEPFIHIPAAYDEDDDSLVFELTVPYDGNGEQIEDYQYPNEIIPTNNNFSFNTTNGEILWETPQKTGEYNVAFLVKEYRNGVLLNTMIRDMQIFVLDCDNSPPSIEVPDEICVVAGETINFDVLVNDPDVGQQVFLEATGAPFDFLINPATMTGPVGYADVPFVATFSWTPRCEDISNNPFEIVFRAVDDFFLGTNFVTGLADLKSTRIKVVGPPPENLEAEADNQRIRLRWDLPYACENTENDFFQGFTIWRAEQSIEIPPDTCSPGIEGKGYVEVGKIQLISENGEYVFEDFEAEKGKTYCYRVVAEFAKVSAAGFPYNFIQSLVSNQVCLQLARDIPVLTKVSVLETDNTNGVIQLEWIKPDPEALDTILNPGPYRYQLQRSSGINGTDFVDITGASFSTADFGAPLITFSYTDTDLDTRTVGHNYRIAFYANGEDNFYDYSSSSSSVFLEVLSADKANKLSWESFNSWNNEIYYLYKFDGSIFDLIDSTATTEYTDVGLINGIEYCYYVESKGSYGIPELSQVILNDSNESCGIPLDTMPPCIPELEVFNSCDQADETTPEEAFLNTLSWNRVDLVCEGSDDIAAYNIYFKFNIEDDFQLLAAIDDIQVVEFDHKPEMGLTSCYAISAVDSVGNESDISPFFCIEDCPSYILPNAFTPNGDGSNDFFIPILNRFVSSVRFEVFNEWGQKVFETNDPEINWDGTNFQNLPLHDGVYYYTCEVFQTSAVQGEQSYDFLKGFIQILKSN